MKVALVFLFCFVLKHTNCDEINIFDLKGVKCGNKYCKPTEYCTTNTDICKSCEQICDPRHHNRDLEKCNQDCQQYQKIKYLEALRANYTELREEIKNNHEHVTSEIQNLYKVVIVFLIITCILFIGITIFLVVRCVRWKKKRNITLAWISSKILHKKKTENQNQSVAVTNASGKLDLRLEMPNSMNNGTSTPATASTGISSVRIPTEDTPLDYAYDNPAMAATPSPNRPNRTPHESQL